VENVVIVDTALSTDNLGDEVIMDAVNSAVGSLFPEAFISRVPSHEALSGRTRQLIYQADWCFLGGSNLLSSNLRPLGLWRVTPRDAAVFKSTRTVALGVGWNDYLPPATRRTRKLLTDILSPALKHSVRDGYTEGHLRQIGVQVLNTSCPTIWPLTEEHCITIPKTKADAAVVTITAWRSNPVADKRLVETLCRHYRKVYFYPQQFDDVEYFEKFGFQNIAFAATTHRSYINFLENEDVDVVGTRLHGGILALQRRRRSLILAVDNRAAEIGKDTGLPVIDRQDYPALENWIEEPSTTRVTLPTEAIEGWKAQFAPAARALVSAPARGRPPTADRFLQPYGLGMLRRIKSQLSALAENGPA